METASGRAGSELIVRRLSDVLFIHILRAWVDSLSDAASWLKALHEPRIAAALALIHKSPGQSWTVESLAREVAMSRSTFSALFTDLVGEPPMRYVARWRLQVAAQLLRRSDMSLSGVAESVGYRSSPGFARKFSREFGVGPGAYRRAQGLEEVAETTEKMLAARR
jgi:AraC-like DNA-binding protein